MERLKERVAHIGQYAVTLLKWMVLGGVIGLVGGIIGSLFHIGVDTATQVRLAHSWVLYLMPVGGLAIVGLYRLTKTEGKGTNDIIASVHFGEQVPGLLVPVIFVSTVITHLCGGSAGREGAALQIGGGIGYQAGRLLRLGEKDLPLATLCGMSGVFAALFGTPLTATVFALEVISVGVLYYAGLVPCLTAALTGYLVSVLMGVPPTRFTVTVPGLEVRTMLLVMVLALLCAVVSILFCRGLHGVERLLTRTLKNPYLRVAVGAAQAWRSSVGPSPDRRIRGHGCGSCSSPPSPSGVASRAARWYPPSSWEPPSAAWRRAGWVSRRASGPLWGWCRCSAGR